MKKVFAMVGALALSWGSAPPASAAAPPPMDIHGIMVYGAPRVTRQCSGGAPASYTISVLVDARRLTAPVDFEPSLEIWNTSGAGRGDYIQPPHYRISPGSVGVRTVVLNEPSYDRSYDSVTAAFSDQGGGGAEVSLANNCNAPQGLAIETRPMAYSDPCGGHATVRIDNRGQSMTLYAFANDQAGPQGSWTVPAGQLVTLDLGPSSALQPTWDLSLDTYNYLSPIAGAEPQVESRYSVLDYDAGCTVHPSATFGGHSNGAYDVLSLQMHPMLVAPVSVYRIVNGKHILVARSKTNSAGAVSFSVKDDNVNVIGYYQAVIGATLRTTQASTGIIRVR